MNKISHAITNQTKTCKYEDFSEDWLREWTDKLGTTGLIHAKPWEQAVIAQALKERGMLEKGKYGIGFGVGSEPLPSLFAATGADILATDQPISQETGPKAWYDTNQLTKSRDTLYKENLISKSDFEERVKFRRVDMNKLPKNLDGKFDFAWSNCCIGHLGSLKNAEEFLINQFKVLKPGGIAVQTTELVVSSLDQTISNNSDTVAWRIKDLERAIKRIEDAGFSSVPLKIELGEEPEDNKIDQPPYGVDVWKRVHIKIILSDFVITQMLLIFEKKPSDKSALNESDKIQNREEVLRIIRDNSDIKIHASKMPNVFILKAKRIAHKLKKLPFGQRIFSILKLFPHYNN